MKAAVATSKKYARALDDGTKIAGRKRNVTIKPRPFFKKTAEDFKPKFQQNVADGLNKLF